MSKTRTHRPLRPSAQWPAIVRDVLVADSKSREKARAVMWQDVQHFVQHVMTLPIGALMEDDEARCDIAVRVLQKLEKNSYAHLAGWFARQLQQRDHSSFWTWIKTVARSCAIDYARTSRRNIAPRSAKRFEWARLDPVDPHVLGEVLGNPRNFLPCGSDEEVAHYLADLQDRLREDPGAIELLPDDDAAPSFRSEIDDAR